jgi:hypothetical protein
VLELRTLFDDKAKQKNSDKDFFNEVKKLFKKERFLDVLITSNSIHFTAEDPW